MKISTSLPLGFSLLAGFAGLGFPQTAGAEVGVSENEILVGESTALTGKDPERPLQFQRGSRLFMNHWNGEGGVHGRKIKIISYDDGYEPQRTFENVQKLMEVDKVFALFQVYGTPNNKSALAAIEPAGIPLVAPLSGGEFLRKPVIKNVFTVRPGATDEAEDMVDFLVKKGIKEISVFHQDDALGMAGLSSAQLAFNKNGISRVSDGKYMRNTQNVEAAIAQIEKGNPKGILLWSVAKPAGEFVKKYALKHPETVFVGHSGTFSQELLEVLKGVKAQVYVFQGMPPLQSSLPIVAQYTKLAKASGEVPNAVGLEGFLDAAVFAEGLKRAGRDLTRSAFISALEGMSEVSIGGIQIKFSPTSHQALSKSYASKVENGRFVSIE